MPECNQKSVYDVLNQKAQDIGYGDWSVKLVIFEGKIIGFDQIDAPVIKFRESKGKKG